MKRSEVIIQLLKEGYDPKLVCKAYEITFKKLVYGYDCRLFEEIIREELVFRGDLFENSFGELIREQNNYDMRVI
jgi:hypothetical protein